MSNDINVLIAEDEFIVAQNIRRKVVELGYRVVDIVSSENEVFEAIDRHRIDLILMDIMLNGAKDGITIAETIKKSHFISFVFITAYSSSEYFNRARLIEPHGYLLKPFTNRDLAINIELAAYKHTIEKGLRDARLELETLNQKLEETVAQRTENLKEVNESLLKEIKRRQLNERKVIESENRYKELTEFLPISIIETTSDLAVKYANIAAQEYFDRTFTDKVVNLEQLFSARDVKLLDDVIEQCRQSPGIQIEEFSTKIKKHPRSFIAYFKPIVSSGGYDGVRVAILDITHRAAMESQLHLLSRAIEQANDCIMITDRESKIEYANKSALKEYGYSYNEITQKSTRIFKTDHHDQPFYANMWNTIMSGYSFSSVFVNKRKDQTTFYEEKTISPVKDKNGEIKNYISTGRNITEKRKAEQTLLENQKFISSINNSVPIIIFIFNLDTNRATFVNNQVGKILGYTPGQICNFSFDELMQLFVGYNVKYTQKLFAELSRKRQFFEQEFRIRHKTSGLKWMSIRFVEFKSDKNGRITELIGSATDITEQKQNERRLGAMMRLNRLQDKRTQKIRTLSLIQGQEEERRRISRDIHDGVGQMLTALKLNVENFDDSDFRSRGIAQKFKSLKELIRGTIVEVRRISNALAPPGLYDFGLYSVTKQLLDQLAQTTSTRIHFDSNIQNIRYVPLVEVTLYRIIQESLNNSLKHSKAENIEVSINQDDEFLRLVVFDDGIGFEYSNESESPNEKWGSGLKNIRGRSIFIGAKFSVLSKPGEGCIIKIIIPIVNCTLEKSK